MGIFCAPKFNTTSDRWELGLGLNPVTASQLMTADHPEVQQWMAWNMGPDPAEFALREFVGDGINNSGKIGTWRWERLPCSYGNVAFWSSTLKNLKRSPAWIGLLRITGAKGENFLLFSYIRSDNTVGSEYLVSTGDLKLLRRFADDVRKHFRRPRSRNICTVSVIGPLPDIQLKLDEQEHVYLPDGIKQDIFSQVDGFFCEKHLYKTMKIPHRRGFLFAGIPGTGKTMMIRQIIRHVARNYRAPTAYLSVNRRTDAGDLQSFFRYASDKKPALLILEDVESLCHETQLTRSEVLAELDGVDRKSGMLLIATANNPSRIDPALLHRPSRFDRVWAFPVPDKPLRVRYIADQFGQVDPRLIDHLAEQTEDWTFAYVKELRSTAAILALKDGINTVEERHFKTALQLLRKQFKAGKSGHEEIHKPRHRVGFGFNEHRDHCESFTEAF